MSEMNKYQVWCDTDLKYEYIWVEEGDASPTTCPIDGINHTIDSSKVAIVETFSSLSKKEADGRIRVNQTSRPVGTRMLYTGRGDDQADGSKVGGGAMMLLTHTMGDGFTDTAYIDFNTIENNTYVHAGIVLHEGCAMDSICIDSVPKVTVNSVGADTNYNIANGVVIVPAAGDGVVSIQDADRRLVQVLPNEDGVTAPAFWNADWNSTTKGFENIAPAPSGDGEFNMFTAEFVLASFAHYLVLNGSSNGLNSVPSEDIDKIPHGVRIRITGITDTDDHDWKFGITFVLYREKSV